MGACFSASEGIKNSSSSTKNDETSNSLSVGTFIKKQQGRLRDNYKIGKQLGKGAFGDVRLCRDIKTKEDRAVKFLNKSEYPGDEVE